VPGHPWVHVSKPHTPVPYGCSQLHGSRSLDNVHRAYPAAVGYAYPDCTSLFCMDALSSMRRILLTILTERILQPLGTRTQTAHSCSV
jgi:hypothetical protein